MKTYALTLAAAAAVLSAVTALAAAPEADALPAPVSVTSGAVYSLDSCRSMALVNNKKLMMTRQRMRKAEYENKEAFAAYLPALDFAGGYMYNQKKLSVFSADQHLPVGTFNPKALVDPSAPTYNYDVVKNPQTGEPIIVDGNPVPVNTALIPKKSMEFDIHNVFFGAVTLTQPIYMGGKIAAMNRLTGYAKEIAAALHNNEAENVVYAVDAAYWQVVSLKAKHDLAVSYVNLLDSLDRNVALMLEQGVATRSDKLSVDVKLNSARVDLTKVENGLTLSRMALAQVCGLPIDADMHCADEPGGKCLELSSDMDATVLSAADINAALQRRPDLRALELGIKAAEEKKNVARSEMMPKVALAGAYSFSNPNMFDGFRNRFNGAFSVGAMVTIPLWHWGGNYYKVKAAEVDQTLMRLELADSRELVNLQINQASFKARESLKVYATTQANLASANENLRCATIGFREGVITTDDVMAAQTAWLKANSENVDAMIDVRLCNVYLRKVMGTLIP